MQSFRRETLQLLQQQDQLFLQLLQLLGCNQVNTGKEQHIRHQIMKHQMIKNIKRGFNTPHSM